MSHLYKVILWRKLPTIINFCVSVTGAALRLGIIDHIQSQKILHKIKPKIHQTLEKFANTKINDCWQFSPQYDLIQMTHEKKFSKMFIT